MNSNQLEYKIAVDYTYRSVEGTELYIMMIKTDGGIQLRIDTRWDCRAVRFYADAGEARKLYDLVCLRLNEIPRYKQAANVAKLFGLFLHDDEATFYLKVFNRTWDQSQIGA